MKIKVYVNFCDREVLNEEAYNERKDELAKEYMTGDELFDEFISDFDNYCMMKTVINNDDFKLLKKLRDGFKVYCENDAEQALAEDFEKFEIEV